MPDFFIRTEEIKPEEVIKYFVETSRDREIVTALKSRTPIIVVGSRGVGKSFLLRVAEAELNDTFTTDRVLPVYVTFARSSLLQTPSPTQFRDWMLAKICTKIIRSLTQRGLLTRFHPGISILSGDQGKLQGDASKIEVIADEFEKSWLSPQDEVDVSILPSVERFKDAVEDICDSLNISRLALFIDEAAHIFLPAQQRQFFTLFRDLRSPFITCNAAVYPGVTSYGDSFQPSHDATIQTLDRDILSSDYILNMREIVEKQAESNLLATIATRAQNFSLLAYAASGNPRALLKTLAKAPKLTSKEVNEVIREHYRTAIWSEHSSLAEKYLGHRIVVDWARKFIENEVLPELQRKNKEYRSLDKNTTCFFWIHRDAPQPVKSALDILAYTGIVIEHSTGIKATRSEIGKRYIVNIGCLFALEATPASSAFDIARNLTPKRMSEYGANYPAYNELLNMSVINETPDVSEALKTQLEKSIEILDITLWQKEKLRSLSLHTVGDVVQATESKLQEAYFVGEKRSRRMRNAAFAAVDEYLSG